MPDIKLLLVGNANHQFITNYAKWLRKKGGEIEIDILTDRPVREGVSKYYDHIYQINFNTTSYRIIKQIKGFKRIYTYFLFLLKLNEISSYDYIHVQYLSLHSAYFTLFVNKYFNASVIISIWGSDFYKYYKRNKKVFLSACKTAKKITFSNVQTKNQFKDEFQWLNSNLFICRFGLAPLESQKKLSTKKRDDAKIMLGWKTNKLAITIGYNMYPLQQHIKILDELAKLTKHSDQIELILPITYGGNKQYKIEILSKLDKLPFDYTIYDQFLTDEKIAQIRRASDVMIQLQVTDQFSGSMQEHLFARNVVITGSWLPYQTMIEHGIEFIRIDSIEELSKKLESVLNQYDSFYQKTDKNPEAILKLSSWESNISDWIQLYE